MKSFTLTICSLLFSSFFLSAQITITQSDFADANDTVRMSVAYWNPLLDYGATGANHTWDFSDLDWQSQYLDEFKTTTSVGTTYAITFSNLSINPYRCNIAKAADNQLTSLPIVSSIFTDGFNFYYKTSSLYRQRGIGMRVAGFPTPIPMTHADTLYHLPMNYGDKDSARSDYLVYVPDLGLYTHKQRRWNEVDGWGTLTTPFGTFDALRVVTEIRATDSIYIDTLSQGFKVDADIVREYKWFGKDQMEPLLQINTQAGIFGQFQGFEFVTRIVYRDSARFRPTAIWDAPADEIELRIYPNPASNMFYVATPANISEATLRVTDISGKVVFEQSINTQAIQPIQTSNWSKGIYLLNLQTDKGNATRKVVVQ